MTAVEIQKPHRGQGTQKIPPSRIKMVNFPYLGAYLIKCFKIVTNLAELFQTFQVKGLIRFK